MFAKVALLQPITHTVKLFWITFKLFLPLDTKVKMASRRRQALRPWERERKRKRKRDKETLELNGTPLPLVLIRKFDECTDLIRTEEEIQFIKDWDEAVADTMTSREEVDVDIHHGSGKPVAEYFEMVSGPASKLIKVLERGNNMMIAVKMVEGSDIEEFEKFYIMLKTVVLTAKRLKEDRSALKGRRRTKVMLDMARDFLPLTKMVTKLLAKHFTELDTIHSSVLTDLSGLSVFEGIDLGSRIISKRGTESVFGCQGRE